MKTYHMNSVKGIHFLGMGWEQGRGGSRVGVGRLPCVKPIRLHEGNGIIETQRSLGGAPVKKEVKDLNTCHPRLSAVTAGHCPHACLAVGPVHAPPPSSARAGVGGASSECRHIVYAHQREVSTQNDAHKA